MTSFAPGRARAESVDSKYSFFSKRRNYEFVETPGSANSENWRESVKATNDMSSVFPTRSRRTASFSHALPVLAAAAKKSSSHEKLSITTGGYESDNESENSQPLTNSPGSDSSVPSLQAHIPPMSHVKLMKYKTAMCSRIGKEGGCRYENACDFAHTSQELRRILDKHPYIPIMCSLGFCKNEDCRFSHNEFERDYHPAVYKTRLCNFWEESGRCPRGAYCSFAHGEDEKRSKRSFEAYAAETPLSEEDIRDAEKYQELERGGCERYVRLIGSGWDKEDKEKLEFFPSTQEKERSAKNEPQNHTNEGQKEGPLPSAHDQPPKVGRLIPLQPIAPRKSEQEAPRLNQIYQSHQPPPNQLMLDNSVKEFENSLHLVLGSPRALKKLAQPALKTLLHFQRGALDNTIKVLREWHEHHLPIAEPDICISCKENISSVRFRNCDHVVLCPRCWIQTTLARCPVCNVLVCGEIEFLRDRLPAPIADNLF